MAQSTATSLGELAVRFGCALQGDSEARVTRVATLQEAAPDAVSFIANPKYQRYLPSTRAGAVILEPALAGQCPVSALIAKNPYATFARIAAFLHPSPPNVPGVHPSAVVHQSAEIDATASIGPQCVVGANVRIGARVSLGPGCIVFDASTIGNDSRLIARVTICDHTSIGERCILHPGVVIGSDGFGNAMDAGAWIKVPQIGGTRIGSDVEIGSNTTIDRGALGDTVIEDGVRLDNLIQIGHNVHIGAHTAMAAFVGVSGSTRIGKRCLIAGKVGIAGHLEICDNVVVMGHSTVSGSIMKPGSYSGALGLEESHSFRRNAARFRQLDKMAKTLAKLAGERDDKSTD